MTGREPGDLPCPSLKTLPSGTKAGIMTGRILLLLLLPFCVFSQVDSVALDEVVVADRSLRMFAGTASALTITDSVISRDGRSLTELLRSTPLYFKENGYGMVSSPSFRGTTAQQTAVVWNGINVNSQLNGLTDFNAAGARDFDLVTVRGGASGTIYGSSAIGGTVHLENDIRFGRGTRLAFQAEYGSFNTSGINFRVGHSLENFALSVSASNHYSSNNYPLPSGRENSNGRYHNTGFSSTVSWKSGAGSTFTYYGYTFVADRNFSLLFDTDPKTSYRDQVLRNMLEWSGKLGWFNPKVKVAHLSEKYTFFEDAPAGGNADGNAQSVVARIDGGFVISPNIFFNAVTENTATNASGTDIGDRNRNVFAGSLMFRHVLRAWSYTLSVRQEASSDYQSPLLGAAAFRIKISGDHFVRGGVAKSFRAPTLNDLYWGTGGNPDLRPETSLQGEAGYHYDGDAIEVQVTGFVNRIRDMIRWLPLSGGQWYPHNEDRVNACGIEMLAAATTDINRHRITARSHYSYTLSTNDQEKQLIYVPVHKGGVALDWRRGRFSADVNALFTGPVHTRSDNNPRYTLDGYATVDARIAFSQKKCTLGFRVRNLTDARYQVVERRYFPGRHYQIEFTFKP